MEKPCQFRIAFCEPWLMFIVCALGCEMVAEPETTSPPVGSANATGVTSWSAVAVAKLPRAILTANTDGRRRGAGTFNSEDGAVRPPDRVMLPCFIASSPYARSSRAVPITSVSIWTLRKAPAYPFQTCSIRCVPSSACVLRAVSEPFDRLCPDSRIALLRIRSRRLVVERCRDVHAEQEVAFPAERNADARAGQRAHVQVGRGGRRRRGLLRLDLPVIHEGGKREITAEDLELGDEVAQLERAELADVARRFAHRIGAYAGWAAQRDLFRGGEVLVGPLRGVGEKQVELVAEPLEAAEIDVELAEVPRRLGPAARRLVDCEDRLGLDLELARGHRHGVRVESPRHQPVAEVAHDAELAVGDRLVRHHADGCARGAVALPVLEVLAFRRGLDEQVGVARAQDRVQRVDRIHLAIAVSVERRKVLAEAVAEAG